MKHLPIILVVGSLLFGCNQPAKQFSVSTQFGTVKAISTDAHYPGDTVFIRQLLDSVGDNWEVLPTMQYHEGLNSEIYLFSRADSRQYDTVCVGIEYRKGVVN